MDLLNENRSLIHTGKLLRQPDSGFEWSGWTLQWYANCEQPGIQAYGKS